MSLVADARAPVGDLALAVALDVPAGTTVAVVGPNGAGKTTLVRALAGLHPLAAGRIELDGAVLDEPSSGTWVPPERRPIGVVFQEGLLFPHLSVVENVAFPLRARGIGRADARRRALAALERMGLADRAGERPARLSGGQAQRVALARALVAGPHLLLLDEPLASLDVSTRAEVRSELRRHLGNVAGVRVLVTHDPLDAAVLADEVVVLDRGTVVQRGSMADVARRPATRWVADLVGTNLLAGTADGHGHIDLAGGGAVVSAAPTAPGAVLAAIAPSSITLHRGRPEGSARNAWPGQVRSITRAADRCRVELDGPPALVAEVTPSAVDELALREGELIWAAVKATEVDVYPA